MNPSCHRQRFTAIGIDLKTSRLLPGSGISAKLNEVMCLILFAYRVHPDYRLLLAANRDEFYRRPTAPARFWEDSPDLLAGRDLEAGGSWCGITKSGRVAMVTNVRDDAEKRPGGRSRGELVSRFLQQSSDPSAYLRQVQQKRHAYKGFNLLVGAREDLFYYSNRQNRIYRLKPGIYGLSNHLLDTDWPKVRHGKNAVADLLCGEPYPEAWFEVLADRWQPPDRELPDTGFGLEWERLLATRFICSEMYGTRSSTLLFWRKDDRIQYIERRFEVHSMEISGESSWIFSLSAEIED